MVSIVVFVPILAERLLQIRVKNPLFESKVSLFLSIENTIQVKLSVASA